jgi:hypothetical protein
MLAEAPERMTSRSCCGGVGVSGGAAGGGAAGSGVHGRAAVQRLASRPCEACTRKQRSVHRHAQ